MPNPLPALKKFVADNKTTILVTGSIIGTAAICAVVSRTAFKFQTELLQDAVSFIEDKELDAAFLDYIVEQ